MPQTPDESHPFLLGFTLCTLCAGLLFLFVGFGIVANVDSSGVVVLLGGGLGVAGAIRALRATRGFTRYSEASQNEQALAHLVALPGAFVALTIFLIPFMMYAALKANQD